MSQVSEISLCGKRSRPLAEQLTALGTMHYNNQWFKGKIYLQHSQVVLPILLRHLKNNFHRAGVGGSFQAHSVSMTSFKST